MFKESVLLVRNKSSVCLGLGLVSTKETHGKRGKGRYRLITNTNDEKPKI